MTIIEMICEKCGGQECAACDGVVECICTYDSACWKCGEYLCWWCLKTKENCPTCDNDSITDKDLLNYLLEKYSLDRRKVVKEYRNAKN